MMGQVVQKVNIEAVLRGCGLTVVEHVNPMNHKSAVDTVRRVAGEPGVKAIIFEYPCVSIVKPEPPLSVDQDQCIGCQRCIREIGCPALSFRENRALIDSSQCTGCTLCSQLCPVEAIQGGSRHE